MNKKLLTALSICFTLTALLTLEPARLPRALATMVGIVTLVCGICVAAGFLEYRCILHRLSAAARPLMRFSRLPQPCAVSFMAAFASGNVAAVMLADSRRDGLITRRQMIWSGLCNSIPSVFMFTLWLTLPVIGLLGRTGLLYFAISFAVMLSALTLFLMGARLWSAGTDSPSTPPSPFPTPSPASPSPSSGNPEHFLPQQPLPWSEAWRMVRRRTLPLLRRLLLLTVPFYMWTACAVQQGWLNFSLPGRWGDFLSPGGLSVLAARTGGLLAASGTAAELLRQREVTAIQVVTALLIGNILNGVTRLLRRGLPLSLGIYPRGDGAIIAAGGVGTRMALTAVAVLILWRLEA